MLRDERFLRLKCRILDSSIQLEEPHIRWLWIAMLILADDAGTGYVDMPDQVIAAKAHLSIEQTKQGLERLSSPDPKSRSEEQEGRRIIPMERASGMEPRGWRIVNWESMKLAAAREAAADRKRKSRARH